MLIHTRLMTSFELSQFGFLIGGQNLHDLGLDASVRDLKFDHGLRVLRGEGAGLAFVEGTAGFEGSHSSMVLLHLLHQRLHAGLFFFPDRLDLVMLIAG